jgi:hypothetical protein
MSLSIGDLVVSKKYPTKIVEIINLIQEGDLQIAVECKIDDGSHYFLDRLSIDTVAKYGTEYKVKRLFTEKWFSIPGFENYQLSSFGRIKSLKPFGNSKFEKILFPTFHSQAIRRNGEKTHYEISFGGVRLYNNGQKKNFLRREVIELVEEFKVENDLNFEEVLGTGFSEYIRIFEKNKHPLEKLKPIYFSKNYHPGLFNNSIVWDSYNCLWCFRCDHAGGYDLWDDAHCFFTSYKEAQMIQKRLNYFQPKLEAKLRETEVLPPK